MSPDSSPQQRSERRPRGKGLEPGFLLNDTFRIRHLIAEGGMGLVYLATHERLPGLFVVKTPHPTLVDGDQIAARLRQEAKVLATLNHPNIVKVFDLNDTPDGIPYLVMEFLDGRDLNEILRARALRPWEAGAIVRQVAAALGAAHACKVVHRDLKPENVLIVPVSGQEDVVKLIDFGVSKLGRSTRSNTGTEIIGTPNYMSPEQAHGDRHQVDDRTDQFALAVMTYEMLAREPPFVSEDPMKVLYRIVNEPLPLLARKVNWDPANVDQVLRRGTAKDPGARYASVREFSEALDAALQADIGGSREPLHLFSPEGSLKRVSGVERVPIASDERAAAIAPQVRADARQDSRSEALSEGRAAVPSNLRTVRTQPVSLRRRRRHGGGLLLLTATAAAAAAVLLFQPQMPPLVADGLSGIAERLSGVGGRFQQFLAQTRVRGLMSTVADPGTLQPRSSDSGSAHPLPP
jgi:serine/threonine protein kinase